MGGGLVDKASQRSEARWRQLILGKESKTRDATAHKRALGGGQNYRAPSFGTVRYMPQLVIGQYD